MTRFSVINKLNKYYGILSYLTDPLIEEGRARLIWASKTADATASLIGTDRVILISSKRLVSASKSKGCLSPAGSEWKNFYQIHQDINVIYVPLLVSAHFLRHFGNLFNRCIALMYFKRFIIPKLSVLQTRDYQAAKVALINGVKVIYEDHDEDFHRDVKFCPSFLSSNLLVEIIAITESVKVRLVNSGVPIEKIRVSSSGVSDRQISTYSECLVSAKESCSIKSVYCGGLHDNRGISYILKLSKRFPNDQFILVGGRGSQVRKWKFRCKYSNVIFKGYLDQLSADRIQKSADILLLPYKDPELAKITSPLKFFNYLATGRPIVCSEIDEIQQFKSKPLAIEWCPVGQCESFIAAYSKLRNRRWPSELLKNNIDLAKRFTWEKRQSLVFSALSNNKTTTDSDKNSLPKSGEYDWVFAMNQSAKGWVLETICSHIEAVAEGSSKFVYTNSNSKYTNGLPRANNYWFAHFNQLVAALRTKDFVRDSNLYVWFTHFKETRITDDELVASLNSCSLIFCTCTDVLVKLSAMGVRKELLRCYIGGANPNCKKLSSRCGKTVGISSGFYPRKNPNLILEVIRLMPDTKFILIAPDPEEINNSGILWSNWEKYEDLVCLPNFEMRTARYVDYPNIYAEMDVFFSASFKEGGPIPLLEAMMSNVYPIVSDTGFARDVIKSCDNGLIFDVKNGGDPKNVTELIGQGLTNTTDVRKYALQFSWENFADKIMNDILC